MNSPTPGPSASTTPDRRLAYLVITFGVLVVAGGLMGAIKGSVASIVVAGPIGLALVASGVAMMRGSGKALLVALALSLVTAVVMGIRALSTGKVMPGLPVGIVGLALSAVLLAARARRR